MSLQHYLDKSGRVNIWPSKKKNKIMVLEYLAAQFKTGIHYSEKEVNAILAMHHSFDDAALLRRELFEYGYLDRARDGSNYCRAIAASNPETARPE